MPDIALSTQAFDRSSRGGSSEFLLNMYSEPQSNGEIHLLSQPGVTQFSTGYAGNLRFMDAKEGVFGGDIFSIHGTGVYRTNSAGVVTEIGQVPATGEVTIAIGRNEVLFCVAPGMWSYNGVDFVPVTLPSVGASTVDYIAQRFVATVPNDDRWYWSNIFDGRTWDGLDFITAEGKADVALRVHTTEQFVFIFGTESAEIYSPNTNPRSSSDAFRRVTTGAMPNGLLASQSIAQEGELLFWVSDRRNVFIANGFRPLKISTPWVHDIMDSYTEAQLVDLIGFAYTLSGHTFFVLTLQGEFTISYDVGQRKWNKLSTLSLGSWRLARGVDIFGQVIGGNPDNADLFALDINENLDAGEQIVQEFSALIQVRQPTALNDLTVDLFSSEAGIISASFSDNFGRTFTSLTDTAVMTSPSGNEDNQVMWRNLGTIRAREQLWRFRMSDPAKITVHGARINDGEN